MWHIHSLISWPPHCALWFAMSEMPLRMGTPCLSGGVYSAAFETSPSALPDTDFCTVKRKLGWSPCANRTAAHHAPTNQSFFNTRQQKPSLPRRPPLTILSPVPTARLPAHECCSCAWVLRSPALSSTRLGHSHTNDHIC